ncbi:hypothetical protein M6D81_04250 [Paenibacillus sp. J5C_2022]|uniref:hypothetical protein n=1 Tax=Paenibacillus sp. J5C2022 TaxID=2977129 RepID=UPI0021CF7F4F|nr:hypothetical protein [Paenibacillus sp. J5C2022]MCU6707916.1 hypothetical protein [Paenibacillus sp. J5C2022]
MSNVEHSHKSDTAYTLVSTGSKEKGFVLWREVLMAYVSPAVMAGIGGLITGDRSLQFAALTTIGGTSALIAWLLGLWLRKRGRSKRWVVRPPRLLVVVMFVIICASLGFYAAWVTNNVLDMIGFSDYSLWFDRVWIEFPLSATIASMSTTWRWRKAFEKNNKLIGGDR